MPVTLRSVKGSALTHAEMDANFTALQRVMSIGLPVSEYGAAASDFQDAIDEMEGAGGGYVDVPAGTYTFTGPIYARDNVCIRCAPGVEFIRNFHSGNTSQAIFCNEDFATYVNNFSVIGRPTLSTSSTGGKIIYIKCHYLRLDVRLGTWYNYNGDGFGITFAGDNFHVEVTGGDPQEPLGVDGVHISGGSGYVKLIGVKSGDDTLGIFPAETSITNWANLDIKNIYAEVINCESTHGRLVAMGIPTGSDYNTHTGVVKNCRAVVHGGRAASVGANSVGMSAFMIDNNSNLAKSKVTNNAIEAYGVDCGGQYGFIMEYNRKNSVKLVNCTNFNEYGWRINDTEYANVTFHCDLSDGTSGDLAGLLTSTNDDVTIDMDVVAAPGTATQLTVGSNGSNLVNRAKVKCRATGVHTSQGMLTIGAGATDVCIDWAEARIAAAATSTVGVTIASGATRTTLRAGDLREVASSVLNASTTTRMDRQNVRTTVSQLYQVYSNTTDFTLYPFVSGQKINLTGTLTANRTITLDTTQLVDGDEISFYRSGGDTSGPWTWTIGSLVLNKDEGGTLVWNASGAAWVLVQASPVSGTFTPAVTFVTPGDFSPTYTTQRGNYVKLGNMCMFNIMLQFSTNAYTTASGGFRITGLPFTATSPGGATHHPVPVARMEKVGISGIQVGGNVIAGTTTMSFPITSTTTTAAYVNVGSIPASTADVIIELFGMYRV